MLCIRARLLVGPQRAKNNWALAPAALPNQLLLSAARVRRKQVRPGVLLIEQF
jgi:hypothetical protein